MTPAALCVLFLFMVDQAEMTARHARILAELSELGLAFARDARADAEAAETPEQRAQQALVFQRVSRSVRQTLALEAKFARDAQRAEREAADVEAKRDREQVRFRKHRLQTAVEALVWRETEDLSDREASDFERELDAAIEDESGQAGFLTEDIAAQVGRILTRLGLEIAPDGAIRKTAHPRQCGDPGLSFDSSG